MILQSDRITFEKGDIICEHGGPADYVMYVLSGEIAMEHSPGLYLELDGRVSTFKRGTLIGEGSAILKRPYMGTLVGFTSGSYARVSAERVRYDIMRSGKLPRMIIEAQARKLYQAFDYILKNYKKADRGQIKELFEPETGFGDFFEQGVLK